MAFEYDGPDGAGAGITSLTGDVTASGPGAAVTTYNNPVPTSKGGWGQSMAMQTDSANGAHNALTPGFIKMTGTAGVVVNGITAPASGNSFTVIYNASASSITLTHQNASASAANRLIMPTAASMTIRPLEWAFLYYDSVQARWILLDMNQITSATSPITISSTGVISMTQANGFQAGYLGTGDYNTFMAKISSSGSPTTNTITYWSGAQTITGTATMKVDPSKPLMGIGTGTPLATLHGVSDYAQTVPDATNFLAILTQFLLPTVPGGGSAAAAPPALHRPQGMVATQNFGGSGYTDNTATWDFMILPGNIGDGLYGVAVSASNGFTEGGTTNPYNVDLNWTDPGGGIVSADTWVAYRQLNGGGFNEFKVITSNPFADDNTGWAATPAGISYYPDFLATGLAHNFEAFGKNSTPIATDVYTATSFNFGYTDSNNGEAYRVFVSVSNADAVRAIYNSAYFLDFPAGGGSDTYDTNTIVVNPGTTVTPTNYGYVSNGSTLNISYDYFATQVINGVTVYAASPFSQNISDPSDGNSYYIYLHSFAPSDGKLNKGGSLGKNIVGNPTFYDDGVTVFGDGDSVTPTAAYAPASQLEAHGSSVTSSASAIWKSLDGTYFRTDIQNSSGTVIGHLEQSGASLKIKSGVPNAASGTVRVNATGVAFGTTSGETVTLDTSLNVGVNINANTGLTIAGGQNIILATTTGTKLGTSPVHKLGFWNATPIVQPVPGVAINDVLSTSGLRGTGGVSNFSTTIKPRTGGTASGSEPVQFTSASLLTTATVGTEEFLTDKRYTTITTGAARKEYTLNDAALTSGTIPVATTNGRLTDSGLTSTNLTSGTYTPTRSAEANLDANVTPSQAQYMRVGSVVTVSGRFTADPTLAATTTSFELSLPVASNLGAAEDLAGVAFCGNIAGMGAEVTGSAANNTAVITWKASDITSQTWSYTYSYEVI